MSLPPTSFACRTWPATSGPPPAGRSARSANTAREREGEVEDKQALTGFGRPTEAAGSNKWRDVQMLSLTDPLLWPPADGGVPISGGSRPPSEQVRPVVTAYRQNDHLRVQDSKRAPTGSCRRPESSYCFIPPADPLAAAAAAATPTANRLTGRPPRPRPGRAARPYLGWSKTAKTATCFAGRWLIGARKCT